MFSAAPNFIEKHGTVYEYHDTFRSKNAARKEARRLKRRGIIEKFKVVKKRFKNFYNESETHHILYVH